MDPYLSNGICAKKNVKTSDGIWTRHDNSNFSKDKHNTTRIPILISKKIFDCSFELYASVNNLNYHYLRLGMKIARTTSRHFHRSRGIFLASRYKYINVVSSISKVEEQKSYQENDWASKSYAQLKCHWQWILLYYIRSIDDIEHFKP